MSTKTLAALVLALGPLAACGGSSSPSPVVPTQTPVVNVEGRFSSYEMWLVQFVRQSDSFRGSYTCSGSLTLNQNGTTLTGFAVVGYPCPAVSFDVSGSVAPDGTVTIVGDSARPVSCQSQSTTYTGVLSGSTLSLRGSATLPCSGEVQGTHRYDYIVTAYRYDN